MKTYSYSLTTKIGSASGSIQANSKEEAERILHENHSGEYTDGKGKKRKNEVVSIDLSVVE